MPPVQSKRQPTLGTFGFQGKAPVSNVDPHTHAKQVAAKKARKINPPTEKELEQASASRKRAAEERQRKDDGKKQAMEASLLQQKRDRFVQQTSGLYPQPLLKDDYKFLDGLYAFLFHGPPFNGHVINGFDGEDNSSIVRGSGATFSMPYWVAESFQALCSLLDTHVWSPCRTNGCPLGANRIDEIIILTDAFRNMDAPRPPPTTLLVGGSTLPTNGVVDNNFVRKDLLIPQDSPADITALCQLGITPRHIRALISVQWMGPRSGLSDARRVLCALTLNVCTAAEAITAAEYYMGVAPPAP